MAGTLADYLEASGRGEMAPLPTDGGPPRGVIPRLRVFTTGVYDEGTEDEREYTEADLDQIVKNYLLFRPLHKPPLGIGHEDRQEMLERSDLPCGGLISGLWREGPDLWASLVQVLTAVEEWVEAGLYRWVSGEVYKDAAQAQVPKEMRDQFNGPVFRRLSLLGATPPKQKRLGQVPGAGGIVWPAAGAARFSERARLVPRRTRPARKGGGLLVYGEVVAVDETIKAILDQAAAQMGLSEAFVKTLSEDQAKALIADWQAKQGTAAPQAPGGSTANADTSGTGTGPTREQMIAELVAMGQDGDVLNALDDEALKQLYVSLKGGPPVPAAGQNADLRPSGAGGLPTAAAASPGMPAGIPTQVVYKYAEASVKVATYRAQKAGLVSQIDPFLTQMGREGRVPPAMRAAVAERLKRAADQPLKYGEVKSELERQMDEIRTWPVHKQLGSDQMQDPLRQGAGTQAESLTPERRQKMLQATNIGRVVLREEKATAAKR